MSITLSEEDMKTFRELATQRTDQSRQKMRLDSELHQKTTFQRKANLTLDETNTFAPDTITYKAVGRM